MMKRRVKIAVNNPVWDAILRGFLMKPVMNTIAEDRRMMVLEVGCGQGGSTETLLKLLPSAFITATDVDDEQICLAERRLSDKRLEFLVEHASEMSFDDDSFDLVLGFNLLHHVPAWRKAVKEAARVLKPGGRYIVTGITTRGLGFKPFRKFVAPKSLLEADDVIAEARKAGFHLSEDFSSPNYMRLVLRKVRGKHSPKTIDNGSITM
jgi:ubiquinone/menaquinone biosynthesis C-methylase UbiE